MKRKLFSPNWATHPGDHIREYLDHLGRTQAWLSRKTGVSTKVICTLIKRRARVTAPIAISLAKTYLSPTTWMNIQSQWDLYQARKR